MELVRQPPGSNKCGQACVAMVAGLTLKQSLKAFGQPHATTLFAVRHVLRKLGFAPAEKCLAFGLQESKLPATCMLLVTYPKARLGHWVVYHEGQVYDPAGQIYPFDLFLLFSSASIKFLALNPA